MAKKTSKKEKKEEKVEKNGNLESFSDCQGEQTKKESEHLSPEEMLQRDNIPGRGTYSRFFSLSTYATEKQIKKVVGEHISSLRALCYIYHDKDESEPHYHVLLRTHSTWTPGQVRRWFADLKDSNKKTVNTFCEIANDIDALKTYILHQDQKSIERGKHRYEVEDIRDYGLSDLAEKKDSYDSSYEILMKVLAGAHPRDLVKYYGRDYLYHHNQYEEVADYIRHIDGYKEARLQSALELANFQPIDSMEEVDG